MAPIRIVRPPARTLPRGPFAALLLAAALLACGRSKSGAPSEPDLSTPEAVFAQATDALSRGDFAALTRVLSPKGEAQVRRDLEAWRLVLRDPTTGPRTLSRLPPAKDEAERAAWQRALGGDLAELLRLYVRADPREAVVPAATVRPADATWAQLDYLARDGSLRRVVMTRTGDRWRVDAVQL